MNLKEKYNPTELLVEQLRVIYRVKHPLTGKTYIYVTRKAALKKQFYMRCLSLSRNRMVDTIDSGAGHEIRNFPYYYKGTFDGEFNFRKVFDRWYRMYNEKLDLNRVIKLIDE